MKQNISTIVILAVVLLTGAACNRQAKEAAGGIQQPPKTTVEKTEQLSKNLHDKLMSSFSPNWEMEEPAATDYPPYYGGSFIDNDGKFVICVVGNPEQYRPVLASILGTDDFLTEPCTYSYREMMQVMDRIDQFLSNSSVPADHPFLTRFAGAGADVFENRVVVQLTEMNDDAIQSFKKDISNSPAVKFEKGEAPVLM
ncbi:hypothetical protein KCV26_13700 [Petrimonas sulfuriphila]|uniref:hypothetical protein n=1 Tax=Petrimonas sulfuriphila TaxID=285070 RepID=UPI003251C9A2